MTELQRLDVRLEALARSARTMLSLGQVQQALRLLDLAATASEDAYGRTHPIALRHQNNLAVGLAAQGDYSSAVSTIEFSASMSSEILGIDHPTTISRQSNRAAIYLNSGLTSEALELLRQLAAQSNEVLGEGHTVSERSRRNLDAALATKTDHQAASRPVDMPTSDPKTASAHAEHKPAERATSPQPTALRSDSDGNDPLPIDVTGRGRSFLAELLDVVRSPRDQQGLKAFEMIERLFPIHAKVFDQAIGAIALRIASSGGSMDGSLHVASEARRLLALTLVPFIEPLLDLWPAEAVAQDLFVRLAQPWADAQLESCVVYITALTIDDYREEQQDHLPIPQEKGRVARMRVLLEELSASTEVNQSLAAELDAELQQLDRTLASRVSASDETRRRLSFLLDRVNTQQSNSRALAALLLRPEVDSPIDSPMQVLDEFEVSHVFEMDPKVVRHEAARLLTQSLSWSRTDLEPTTLSVEALWVYVEPAFQSPYWHWLGPLNE